MPIDWMPQSITSSTDALVYCTSTLYVMVYERIILCLPNYKCSPKFHVQAMAFASMQFTIRRIIYVVWDFVCHLFWTRQFDFWIWIWSNSELRNFETSCWLIPEIIAPITGHQIVWHRLCRLNLIFSSLSYQLLLNGISKRFIRSSHFHLIIFSMSEVSCLPRH